MYLELTDIVVLAILSLVVLLWWNVQSIRQIALRHARRRCKELELQFLDGSVAINFTGFHRTTSGRLGPRFRCRFEFSATGDDRYQGEVLMLGMRVLEIRIPPHHFQQDSHDRLH